MCIWKIYLYIKKGHCKIKYIQKIICIIVISEEEIHYAKYIIIIKIKMVKKKANYLCVGEEWKNFMISNPTILKLIDN